MSFNDANSQERGNGCRIGNTVFTQYLGMGTPYVARPDQPYYNSNGRKLEINNNNSNRYICGAINDYPQGSYYDNTIPPYGANVTIPAQHELVSESSTECVTSTMVNGSLVGSGGRIVTYELNPPSSCSGQAPNNAPLDDYMLCLILIASGFGVLTIRKQKFAFKSSLISNMKVLY